IYLFNILIVLSDIVNIFSFLKDYEMFKDENYFKTFYLKLGIDLFFLLSWLIVFGINLRKWYLIINGTDNSCTTERETTQEMEEDSEESEEEIEEENTNKSLKED